MGRGGEGSCILCMVIFHPFVLSCGESPAVSSFPLHRRYASSLAQKISEQQRTIHRLQSARTDRLRGFGEWMPQVIQAINQAERQFSKKPVGPVGMYVCQVTRMFIVQFIGLA